MNHSELKDLVCALERRVWTAVIQKDGAALRELFAPDYIEITLDGKRVEKTEIVTQSPQVDEIESYTIDSEQVVPLGETGAILSYHLYLKGSTSGAKITPQDRWATSIWSMIEGTWQCCFFQQSPYPSGEHSGSRGENT